jgi:hypothetical protein
VTSIRSPSARKSPPSPFHNNMTLLKSGEGTTRRAQTTVNKSITRSSIKWIESWLQKFPCSIYSKLQT